MGSIAGQAYFSRLCAGFSKVAVAIRRHSVHTTAVWALDPCGQQQVCFEIINNNDI
jgi:hypothetical protein